MGDATLGFLCDVHQNSTSFNDRATISRLCHEGDATAMAMDTANSGIGNVRQHGIMTLLFLSKSNHYTVHITSIYHKMNANYVI